MDVSAADSLPPYRIYPCPGGWWIETPSRRRYPHRAKRAAVHPTVWDAMFWLLNNMHVKWRDIGWMTRKDSHD